MNELLNEGLVPHNFSWRAGIGQNVQQTSLGNLNFNPTTKGFDPLSPGSVTFGMGSVELNNPSPTKAERLKIQQQVLSEIDRIATEFCNKDNTEIEIKNNILSEYIKLRKLYDGSLDTEFYKNLYKICILQYTNVWVNDCSKQNIQAFKDTEFITVNKELHINPLLIYSLFTRTETGITDVSPIDNETKLIQKQNIHAPSSKLDGFIEELDMVYNEIMTQDKPKEVLKMELLSRLQTYKKKYIKFIPGQHDNLYTWCSSKPTEIGQFIYDIFYAENVRIYD